MKLARISYLAVISHVGPYFGKISRNNITSCWPEKTGNEHSFAQNAKSISGLVPGNPKMKTSRPTAERLLSQFGNLHLLIQEKGKWLMDWLRKQGYDVRLNDTNQP